jgi:MarR family transcriptional regulator, organic hydroperoxide resistance regulator
MVEVGNYRWYRISWASIMSSHKDPGAEAWELMFQIFMGSKPQRMRIAQEYGLSPMQLFALGALEPDQEVPMSTLAELLVCDASNVTGIVDRLESRGLIERRAATRDRRVKLLALTENGLRLREEAIQRMLEPPPEIARLSRADQRALRDALRRAVAQRDAKAA